MIIKSEYSSHLPVLMRLVNDIRGPVLEMGVGIHSTPLLHWACFEKAKLVSYENAPQYLRYFKSYRSPWHDLILVKDWSEAKIEQYWWLAFIDHDPGIRRKEDIKRLANYAKYIVIHDTQLEKEDEHHYEEIYPLFKYRFDYKKNLPHTSVLSNFVDLRNLENSM